MTETKLNPCPLCAGGAREINAEDLHLSFAIYDGDGNVELNFLHYGGIQCDACGLLLPFHGAPENRLENIDFWNSSGRDVVAPDDDDAQLLGWRTALAKALALGVEQDFTDALGEACERVDDLEVELKAVRARINELEDATGGCIP